MASDLKTPFTSAFPTPSGEPPADAGVVDGYDMGEGSQKATRGTVRTVETWKFGEGDPGVGGQVGDAFRISTTQKTID